MANATIPKDCTSEYRQCARCGATFYKKKKYSARQWAGAFWCSRRCGAWNLGLTKDEDERLVAIARQVAISAKGRTAWNKGLTKEVHPSLATISEKVSAIQKGRAVSDSQLAGLAIGRAWAKGRTRENTPSIARAAGKRSEILAGRKSPEHSARMRAFYKENPEKHPNAIMGRKTKGRGKTHIEVLLGQYIDELGLEFEYNMKIGRRWPDYFSAPLRLAIEADGERWHQDVAKERSRDAEFHALGCSILHLSGSLIVRDPGECKKRIMEAVDNAKRHCGIPVAA